MSSQVAGFLAAFLMRLRSRLLCRFLGGFRACRFLNGILVSLLSGLLCRFLGGFPVWPWISCDFCDFLFFVIPSEYVGRNVFLRFCSFARCCPTRRKTSHKNVDNIFHDHTNTKITKITKTLGHRSSGRTGGHGRVWTPSTGTTRPGRRRSKGACRRNATGKSETSRHPDASHEITPKKYFVTR